MKPKILIINGPNLNLLGRREPEVYGTRSFEDFYADLTDRFGYAEFSFMQSNCEGEIIDRLHADGFGAVDGIVINPGAYTHYSHAIADAIAAVNVPVVEVHISNIHSREDFRHTSVTARAAAGVIAGFGLESYVLGVRAILDNVFTTGEGDERP